MPFVYQLISLFRSTYFFFFPPCTPVFTKFLPTPRNKDDRGINYPGEVSRNDEKKERFIVFIHRRVSRRITIIILYNKYSLLIFTRNELDKKCSKRDINEEKLTNIVLLCFCIYFPFQPNKHVKEHYSFPLPPLIYS